MRITELDRKLFKNIPPNCPPPAEGQVTFHDHLSGKIVEKWDLLNMMGPIADVIDLYILEYEESGLPEKQGIFRFPDPKDTHIRETDEGYTCLLNSFYLEHYFDKVDVRWNAFSNEEIQKIENFPLYPGIQSKLDQMDADEEAVRDTVGSKFLSLLKNLGLTVLCAVAAFGFYKLIGISAAWGRGAGLLMSLVLGTVPLLSWALMIAGGIGAAGLLLYSLIGLLQLLQSIFTAGKRRKRKKAYWQAYREALRCVRLRQLFYQHLTGKESITFRDMQRMIERKAAPYLHQFKW